MSQPFVSEIQLFPFNFNPVGWAFCRGSLLPIAQNTALFSLLGTMYGGDGKTTFQLPNYASRAATGAGQGPGLMEHFQGQVQGSASVSLLQSEIPMHTHAISAFSQTAPGTGSNAPVSGGGLSFLANSTSARTFNASPNTTMAPNMLQTSGTSLPHENRQPYLALNFCIALQGVFPPRP